MYGSISYFYGFLGNPTHYEYQLFRKLCCINTFKTCDRGVQMFLFSKLLQTIY